jgi:dihydrofolate reductase
MQIMRNYPKPFPLRRTIVITITLALLVTSGKNAQAADCLNDAVKALSRNEACLYTHANRVFLLLGQDFIDQTTWNLGDKLQICPYETQNHIANIYKLLNKERGETLVGQDISQESWASSVCSQ